jgi:hypothetical protein
MREDTKALLSVSATLGPRLLVVVEVLRALSGLVRRNASPLSVDESCENGAQVSCVKCLRAGWGGFEHRDRISTYGEYNGSEEEACGGTFPTFLELGANDKNDLAFKVEGDDHFVDPMQNRVDHCNLTLRGWCRRSNGTQIPVLTPVLTVFARPISQPKQSV